MFVWRCAAFAMTANTCELHSNQILFAAIGKVNLIPSSCKNGGGLFDFYACRDVVGFFFLSSNWRGGKGGKKKKGKEISGKMAKADNST